jgi:hypothetical protein
MIGIRILFGLPFDPSRLIFPLLSPCAALLPPIARILTNVLIALTCMVDNFLCVEGNTVRPRHLFGRISARYKYSHRDIYDDPRTAAEDSENDEQDTNERDVEVEVCGDAVRNAGENRAVRYSIEPFRTALLSTGRCRLL